MDDLITAMELASRLRIRPATVRRWTREGLIPAIRITDKVTRYEYTKVCAALQARGSLEREQGVQRGRP